MPVTTPDALEIQRAVESIAQLKARYFRTLDTKDWDGFRAVFADDAQIGPIDSGLPPSDARPAHITDADAFAARVSRNLAEVVSVHHGHMPELTVHSRSAAEGIWAMEDLLFFPAGSEVNRLHGWGHYHETYVRIGDTWKIKSMRLTRLRVELD